MFTLRTMERRLMRLYESAPADALESREWYRSVMARDVTAMASDYALPYHVAAAVMATLSPGTSYAQNVNGTRRTIAAFVAGSESPPVVAAYGANRAKAWRILQAMPDTIDSATSPLLGKNAPKVRAFFANAMGDDSVVTLDRHAVRPLSKTGDSAPRGVAEHARMAEAYRRCAGRVGMAPADFQAVIWVAVRGAAE